MNMRYLLGLFVMSCLQAQLQTINGTDAISTGPGKLNSNFTFLNANKAGRFSGSGAPGLVTGSVAGDIYVDTSSFATYACSSVGPCSGVSTGNWQQINISVAGLVTSFNSRVGAVVPTTGDYTAAQVTNAVSTLGSYANPTWIASLAGSKISGAVPTATALAANGTNCSAGQAAQGVDASGNAEGCFNPAGGLGFTQGSVVFANSMGNAAQDNANFFWDLTNHRLGIGTNAPAYPLDILGGGTTPFPQVRIQSTLGTQQSMVDFWTAGTRRWSIGGDVNSRSNLFFIYDAIADRVALTAYPSGSLQLQPQAGDVLTGVCPSDANFQLDVCSSGSAGTVRLWDQTATTGATSVIIRAGAGQSTTKLTTWANASNTPVASMSAAGDIVVNSCTGCGGGSGTVNTGTAGQIAYYASSTNAVSGATATGAIKAGNPPTQAACADLSNGAGGCSMSTTAGGDLSGTLPSPTVAKVNGIAYSATAAAHSIEVVTTANTTATAKVVPDCQDTGGNHLNFTQSSDTITCGTSGSGSGGGWVMLEHHTANGTGDLPFTTCIDSTNAAIYDNFKVLIDHVVPNVDDNNILLRFSTNGGSTYDTAGHTGAGHEIQVSGGSAIGVAGNDQGFFLDAKFKVSHTASLGGISAEIILFKPAIAATAKTQVTFQSEFTTGPTNSTVWMRVDGGGQYETTGNAVNAFKISTPITDTGNVLNSGDVYCYGIVKM